MLAKIGKGILLLIGILMILSVTVFDPADITKWAKREFGLTTGPRADRDIEGMAPTTGREDVEKRENAAIRALVEGLRIDDTRATVEHLSTLPASRVAGYPGCEMAAQYVEDQFRAIGLQGVRSQPFEVTVPIDDGGVMEGEGLGGKVELFALWPNEVRTSTLAKDFTGVLVDGRTGRFADFNGKPMTRQVEDREGRPDKVANAVVLMDFDCGQDWMHAAMLGAKAVVFFDNGQPGEPPAVTRGEAKEKFVGVPANIPRFWISAEDGRRLRQRLADRGGEGLDVRLKARMEWRQVETRNIMGVIPGTLPPVKPSEDSPYKRQRIIVLSAFYDAMSVVPRIAPGAENACGLAALLQTARVLKRFPPRHTIVFLATSSHFQSLWGTQWFLHKCLPSEEELERSVLPKGRVDFDLFVGLDLTSHHHQVATTCFGTFYNRNWEMNVYRKNLLAPYAKHFTEYADRVFRKSMSEATCPHINAITPPKKTWKNFVPRPVAFDAEAVVARGKDAVTLFTPHEIRTFVDTPNDTIDRMDLEKLHTQVKTVAAVIAKAGRDVQFFADSKLHLEDRIQFSRGNVTWFDRAVNPNIPKAPIGGAVVTFRHPGAAVTNAGVRTLYTAYSQPDDPRGGDYREGYYIENVTLNSRRVRVNVWSEHIGEVEGGTAVIQSHRWLREYELEPTDDSRALIRVAERFVLDEDGPVRIPEERAGRWEPASKDIGKRKGFVVPASEDDPNFPTPEGWAHVQVGNARFRGPILIPAQRHVVEIDLDPPGWFDRWVARNFQGNPVGWFIISVFVAFVVVYFLSQRFGADSRFHRAPYALGLAVLITAVGTVLVHFAIAPVFGGKKIPEVERAYDEPDVDARTRRIRQLQLQGSEGSYEPTQEEPVGVAFGDFEGQFVFPFVYFWRWAKPELLAYKLDRDGTIVYAQDEGNQGKETYPNEVKFGGGAQCVLFRCRPMTILEIVDSRYLTVLDQVGVLGTDNSVPQQWGARYIKDQSRREGRTVSASVVFARYDPTRDDPADRYHRLKIHMGTGLYGIKLLLTNARPRLDGQTLTVPPRDPTVRLGLDRKEARGEGYVIDGRVLLNPTYRVAWDMWVLNEYRLRELDRYGISNAMLASFPEEAEAAETRRLGLHDRARYALIDARRALEEKNYDRFIAESRRAWGFEAKAYPDVAAQADDTVKGVVFYFVLLIPFAFFMERLLIGAADIRKRIGWFAIIFMIVFVVLRLVHPAFKLSTSPYIILLAFIILSMGVIVLFIIVNKFNIEIRKMKQAEQGIQQADVGRLSASYAAVMLGISNLRKRKVRTSLTAVTLTLLTFTVLSFTSINKSLYLFRLSRSNVPAYEGGLVRDRNWRGLQDVVLEYLRSEFEDQATIAPRAWLVSKTKGEKAFFEFTAPGGRSNVNGLVGLTPQETEINPDTGPQTMLLPGSRWFKKDDRYVCILPTDVAERVGILAEHLEAKDDGEKPEITMLGHRFTVIGLIDSEQFNQYKDIDDEKLTPVDT
ncbi:MAG: M28 family peptidase, partial [Planctomycetota bacterium]